MNLARTAAHAELLELLSAVLDERATGEQVDRLDAILSVDRAARQLYRRGIHLHVELAVRKLDAVGSPRRPVAPRYHGAVQLAIRLTIAAVLVLSCVAVISWMVRVSSHRPVAAVPIATLVDATNARFDPSDIPTRVGSQLPGGFLRLRSGTAKIEFYSGAQVTLTGPAEFGLNSPMRGLLRSGKLTAYVPAQAHGFTVGGPGVAVVDLGTRFTMSVDPDGRTDVFVREGKVRLESDTGEKQELSAGRTARMARDEPIVLLPPEPITLDLADLVGGGNGLGTGHNQGIDPATGEIALTHHPVRRLSDLAYHPTSIPGIDGVFIPAPGSQHITSTGLSFTLSTASKLSWDDVWNGPNFNVPCIAGGVDYGRPPHTVLGLHANKGITFNLRTLRNAHPGYRAQEFAATAVNTKGPGDFWVLVDGRVMFHRALSGGQVEPIRFDLHEQDRFLTVMTVNGGWLFLADAKLIFTTTISNDNPVK